MAYDNTNKGTLGKNKHKNADTHPEYAGSLNVEGDEYWVSAWIKTNTKTKEKFFALSIKKKEPKQAAANTSKQSPDDDFDDDIPF